ncbi:hypothetical protein EHF33_13580 [Deinococcus psychrotolerans]|uniref:Copper amine oxidase-like N-terminal domain-containing protein n=1 Tax=Deinococcus psychrotolerans TaxID=2489213 RepID=A0A3G8YEB4_9DEIO|nr:hypothetical protein [Deinococcus psychrotolerans]AZI43652.1 hypothetical protein EHF33_13580 [Deinococcus psychrotolerans]
MTNLALPSRSRVVRRLLLSALLTLPAASAQTLILNGKVSNEKTVVVGGKVYVPLSALPSLGVQVSSGSGVTSLTGGKAVATAPSTSTPAANNGSGGVNQKASVSGCINEWLFNGVWRMRVTKVMPIKDEAGYNYGSGWGIAVEIRNGTAQTIRLADTGIVYNGAMNLAFSDGDSWAKDTREGWQDKTYAKLPQGAGFLYTFRMYPEAKMADADVLAKPPQKFLLENLKKIDSDLKNVGFTVPDPSFRVDLTCKK